MTYLLDTNILSELVRPQPNEAVQNKVKAFERECAVATLVWHELLYGFHRMAEGAKKRTLERYLFEGVDLLPKLAYDDKAARWQARERAKLERLGQSASFVDGQIAAVAATNGLSLVTRNVRDFENFEDLEVQNWFV